MVVFPLLAVMVSAACAVVLGYDTWRRPRPDRVVWTLAFAVFAIGAGAEVVGSLSDWTEPLVRVYYLSGAVLVVGYLALGEGYLLARDRIEKWAPGLTILVTALAATLVINAPIDEALLATHGWESLERGPALVALTVSINVIGSIVLIGGALYSARSFRRVGIMRERMIGCILIAAGTFIVAMGGTLTRFGQREYLYIAMSIGVATIFAGVLKTRHRDRADWVSMPAESGHHLRETPRLISLPNRGSATVSATNDAGIRYIETRLLPLEPEAISADCTIWSVPLSDVSAFDRSQARRVWRVRSGLTAQGQERFDALPPAVRLQIAELYLEVFSVNDIAQSG